MLLTYQVSDASLNLRLGQLDGILLANDGDEFLVRVLRGGEDNASARLLPHLTDVGTSATNEEFVILWLGT